MLPGHRAHRTVRFGIGLIGIESVGLDAAASLEIWFLAFNLGGIPGITAVGRQPGLRHNDIVSDKKIHQESISVS